MLMLKKNQINRGLVIGILLMSAPLFAQPFCSLRDPVSIIDKMVPQSDSFRSSVVNINNKMRNELIAETGITMHRQELGYHTLDYVYDTGKSETIIHVRPEATRWGITEIAWSISSDGQIIGYEFQRCRASSCDDLNSASLFANVPVLDGASLAGLLGDDHKHLSPIGLEQLTFPAGSDTLVVSVIRSGIKAAALIKHTNS